MTPLLPNTLPGKRRLQWLLIAFGLTTICFGCMVALVIYADTHGARESDHAIRQTQDVLLRLAEVSQQLDRIELHAGLYRATGDEDQERLAQGAAAALQKELQGLGQAVWTPLQKQQLRSLRSSSSAVTSEVLRPAVHGEDALRGELATCRRIVGAMQADERALLAERSQQAQQNDLFGVMRRIAAIGTGSVLVLVLFGFLVRDAVRRGQFERRLAEANGQLRSTVERLEQQGWESRLLIAARDEVALCLEVQQAQACTVRYLEQLLPGTAGRLCVMQPSRPLLESVGSWGAPEGAFDEREPECCCGLRTGRARWRRPEQSTVHCGHFVGQPPERYLCLPLTAHGETLGLVHIECASAELAEMTAARESALRSLSEMAAMAIAGLKLRQKLENQSIRDGMTGLFNRSFLEMALEREVHRAMRQGREIAVMMLDIDQFKQFNDTFGHEAGDTVLRETAACLREGVRSEDLVCRYGGEEFVVILPEAAGAAAMERAELLRRAVGTRVLRYRGQLLRQVTISVGVAMYPQDADAAGDLLRSADRALYEAKHRGRNCVVAAESSRAIAV